MSEPPDPLADIRADFFLECEECLEKLSDVLSEFEGAIDAGHPIAPDLVNVAFRAVHTIKGGAGAFALEPLVRFTHEFESALETLRAGRIGLSSDLVCVFRESADYLSGLVSSLSKGQAPSKGADTLLSKLIGHGSMGATSQQDPTDVAPPWDITFYPRPELFLSGNEPLFLLNALRGLGATHVQCHIGDLPQIDQLDPDAGYLGWTLTLPAACKIEEITEVFEFVEDACHITITSQRPAISETVEAPPPQISEQNATVRVDFTRIDRLMNLVSELSISQSILVQSLSEAGLDRHSLLANRLDTQNALTRDIQDNVMAIRAQPVKGLFGRMGRLLRETAASVGKSARLEVHGELTEVDRTVIEGLSDPLMHMIRNAVDHGLESPDERCTADKPEEGKVTLSAAHHAGRLIIDLGDDGRGLDRVRIRDIALKKGLITGQDALSDDEIDKLLFRPGFSTAKSVTDLSGRGVGMDVVKTEISRLGGRISIQSEPGRGTRFIMSLPLSLAIMDGLVVSCAGHMMVVPLVSILETAALAQLERSSLAEGQDLVRMRNQLVPLVDVGASLGFRTAGPLPPGAIVILVVTEDDSRSALVVDAIHDQRQVVVKPIRAGFGDIPGVSAATILGDGRIAIIVDAGGLLPVRPAAAYDKAG
ncbi:MAG: chemotaxis protein CheA [Albidovulum sp.]